MFNKHINQKNDLDLCSAYTRGVFLNYSLYILMLFFTVKHML